MPSAPSEGNLQYTELFGALKGSATGIDSDRIGIFEKATRLPPKIKSPSDTLIPQKSETKEEMNRLYDGGTIFLDEMSTAQNNDGQII
jgi:DNA-binding NtrC family response regulator